MNVDQIKIQMLFDAAIQMESAEREPFLDKECGDDDAMRAEVESLLEHHFSQAKTIDSSQPSFAPLPENAISHIPERWKVGVGRESGGMGSVYDARDTVLDRRVAIKLLHKSSDDPQTKEKVLSEARAMASLQHPSICPIHEVMLDTEVPFLVMQWVDGVEFHLGIKRIDLKDKLSILKKLISAVDVMHLHNIIHGDIKPRNILIDRNGNPVLVDFGLAHGMYESRETSYGGTPGFSAPEQFIPKALVGPPADVYALGVLLYMILCDRTPFTASSASSLIRQVRDNDPPLPQEINPKVPAGLQAICLKALEREPELRYQTAGEMLCDVERYFSGETVVAKPSQLTGRFVSQVDHQVEEVHAWRKQELVTRLEANKLINLLRKIRQPDSSWLLDSRRLSPSQVLFYLGGWLLLVTVTVCFFFLIQEKAISPTMQWIIPSGFVLIAMGTFAWMLKMNKKRFVLGYAMLANFLLPIALYYLIRDQQWLEHSGSKNQLLPFETNGMMNAQLLLNSSIWLVASLGFRKITHAAPLTIPSVFAGLVVWLSAWSTFGLLEVLDKWGFLGVGIAVAGFIALLYGLRLNTIESKDEYELGHRASRRGDAWPISTMAIIMVASGLGLAAWYWPAFFFYLGPSLSDNEVKQRATAFFIVAVVLWLVTCLLDRKRTPLRLNLGSALRWILPTATLLPIALLSKHSWDPYSDEWYAWNGLLVVGAIGFAIWSIKHQWKPFLVSGLGYLATSVFILFFGLHNASKDVFETHVDQTNWFNSMAITSTVVIAFLAIAALFISWFFPSTIKD
jgi:serine/threonine protein kinase